MKKRILSTLLTLCVVLALMPVTALAADSDFVIESGVLVKYTGSGGTVTIPNSVTYIRPSAFEGCTSLTSVTIPNSVTGIGNDAFWHCNSLTSVTIPSSVTGIGFRAFCDCSSLTSVTIPGSVATIADQAFADCDKLANVTIQDGVTSIGFAAFSRCYALTSVTIPNSVTTIDSDAFAFCSSLTNVTIPDSVTNIGKDAFRESGLTGNITIPNSIRWYIEDYTFFRCENLTSVTIPAGITRIGYRAFEGCNALTDVYFGGDLQEWERIRLFTGNDPLTNANLHLNSTGPNTPGAPSTPGTPTTGAVLSPQKLAVNGKNIDCEKYNIGGSNYFKLRDLAQVLNGTGSQFEVGYDETTSSVIIVTGQAYTSTGTELKTGVDNSGSAGLSSQSILIDGKKYGDLTVYNIGGSNFFQLRELGNVLGFEVGYDANTNTATVTSK